MIAALLVAAALAWLVLFPLVSRPVALGYLICLHVVADIGSAAGDPSGVGFYVKVAIWGVLLLVALGTMRNRLPHRAGIVVCWSFVLLAAAAVVALVEYGWGQSLMRDLIQYTSYVLIFIVGMRWGVADIRKLGRTLLAATTLPLTLVVAGGLGRTDYFMFDGRATGAFSHPNAAAAFAGLTFVVAFGLLVFAHYRLMFLPLLLSGVAMVLATSMTTLASVACALLLLFLLSKSVALGTKLLSLVFVVVLVLAVTSIPVVAERIAEFANIDAESALASGQSANSFEWRILNWDLLLQAWQERPIAGYGLGSTAEYLMPLGSIPHSMPIEILVEFGALATAVSMTLGLIVFVTIARHRKRGRWEADLLLALLIYIIIGGATSNLISYNGPIILVLLLVGLLAKFLTDPAAPVALPAGVNDGGSRARRVSRTV